MLKCAHTSVELYAMIITKQMLAGNGNLLVIKSISVDSRENILGKMWWREQVKKCLRYENISCCQFEFQVYNKYLDRILRVNNLAKSKTSTDI